jgi:TPR repeat protein
MTGLKLKAVVLVSLMALAGCAETARSLYVDASLAALDGDHARAFTLFQKAAETGHAESQFKLALQYQNGEGVARNYSFALHWYFRAAEKGHPIAMNNIGVLVDHGNGVRANNAQTLGWFLRAASSGSATALTNIGNYYREGVLVRRDPAEAYFWYAMSYKFGFDGARAEMDKLKPWLKKSRIEELETRVEAYQPGVLDDLKSKLKSIIKDSPDLVVLSAQAPTPGKPKSIAFGSRPSKFHI